MAESLMWLGLLLLSGSVMGAMLAGATYAVLTPTQKSPDRPGDRAGRRSAEQSLRFELLTGGLGMAFLVTGIALHVVTS